MAINGISLLTNAGVLEAKISKMINLRATANGKAPFGIAIPLQKYKGALADEVVFNAFQAKAKSAGFDVKMLDRLTVYLEKMVQKFV